MGTIIFTIIGTLVVEHLLIKRAIKHFANKKTNKIEERTKELFESWRNKNVSNNQ